LKIGDIALAGRGIGDWVGLDSRSTSWLVVDTTDIKSVSSVVESYLVSKLVPFSSRLNVPFPVMVTGESVLVALSARTGDPFAATPTANTLTADKTLPFILLISTPQNEKTKINRTSN
jgi:hypothetical protein